MSDTHDRFDDATLARFLSGGATPEEQIAIRRWLESDIAHQRELETLRAAWEIAARPAALEFNTSSMRRTLAARASASHQAHRAFEAARRRSWIVPGAAAVVAAATVGFVWFASQSHRPAPQALEWREVATARGQRADVYLSDGSRVQLGPESRIRFTSPLADTARDVMLDGRALLTVKHDSLRPFRVHTSGGIVEDLGTRFDVRQYAGDTLLKVVVAEGLVAVGRRYESTRQVTLAPGDLGVLGPSGTVQVRHGVDVARETDWTSGRTSFDDVALRDAVRELRRYYDLEFVLADSAIGARRLTASFDNEAPEEVVRVIALSLELRYRMRGNTVTFVPQERMR